MDDSIERHLNGYNLPSSSLWEIKRVLEKRYKSRFWEGMSPEGREAMQQEIDNDAYATGKRENKPTIRHKEKNKLRKEAQDTKRVRTISFSDSYRKSATRRLDGDITDANFKKEDQKRIALGGKIESAMETIEIVKYGDNVNVTADDNAIAETAKLNSVEKCLVWMEVNNDVIESTERQVCAPTTRL